MNAGCFWGPKSEKELLACKSWVGVYGCTQAASRYRVFQKSLPLELLNAVSKFAEYVHACMTWVYDTNGNQARMCNHTEVKKRFDQGFVAYFHKYSSRLEVKQREWLAGIALSFENQVSAYHEDFRKDL